MHGFFLAFGSCGVFQEQDFVFVCKWLTENVIKKVFEGVINISKFAKHESVFQIREGSRVKNARSLAS